MMNIKNWVKQIFQAKPFPEIGDKRTRTLLLLWPLCLEDKHGVEKCKWMVFAKVEEEAEMVQKILEFAMIEEPGYVPKRWAE